MGARIEWSKPPENNIVMQSSNDQQSPLESNPVVRSGIVLSLNYDELYHFRMLNKTMLYYIYQTIVDEISLTARNGTEFVFTYLITLKCQQVFYYLLAYSF